MAVLSGLTMTVLRTMTVFGGRGAVVRQLIMNAALVVMVVLRWLL